MPKNNQKHLELITKSRSRPKASLARRFSLLKARPTTDCGTDIRYDFIHSVLVLSP